MPEASPTRPAELQPKHRSASRTIAAAPIGISIGRRCVLALCCSFALGNVVEVATEVSAPNKPTTARVNDFQAITTGRPEPCVTDARDTFECRDRVTQVRIDRFALPCSSHSVEDRASTELVQLEVGEFLTGGGRKYPVDGQEEYCERAKNSVKIGGTKIAAH